MTGDKLYLNAFQNLTINYRYDINIINSKITQPSDSFKNTEKQ